MFEKDAIVLYWARETQVPQHPNMIAFQLEEGAFHWAEGWIMNFPQKTQLCLDLRTIDNVPVAGTMYVNVALSYAGAKTAAMLPDGNLLEIDPGTELGVEQCWISNDGMLTIEPVILDEQMIVQLVLCHEEGVGSTRTVSFGSIRLLLKPIKD